MNVQMMLLRENVGNLNDKDQQFAQSMLKQFARKGTLSDRQWPWVGKLVDKAVSGYPVPEQEGVGDFAEVYELFALARSNLKWPKVRLQLEDGTPVVLSVAGPRSRCPGTINVTDGRPYGDNVWFGRIDAEGTWTKGRVSDRQVEHVGALLRRLQRDPAAVAAKYGRLTGNCCFCHSPLSDERSTSTGYGPTCAKNYGLAWGK